MPDLRKTGITIAPQAPWGAHICLFFETRADLYEILIPYFQAGLAANEFCLWLLGNADGHTAARNALRAAVPDLDRREAQGDIEFVPHDQWFHNERGEFDLERILAARSARLNAALATGHVGMRVGGDYSWAAHQIWHDYVKLEQLIQRTPKDLHILTLCPYALEALSAAMLMDIAALHELLLARRRGQWVVLQTPELLHARRELLMANMALEERIRTRTAELADANTALTRAEAKYRNIFENAVEGIFQTAPDGAFLSVNPSMARTLGYDSTEEFINRRSTLRALGFADPQDWEEIERTLQRQGVVAGFRCEALRADGSRTWISLGIRSITDPKGAVLAYEGWLEDISRQIALEEQLRQVQKMEAVGQLAGGIAHDFNNLLTVINGYAEMLVIRNAGNESIEKDLRPILNAGRRAAILTQRLLAFSRRQILVPRPVDLNAVVRDMQPILRRLIPENLELTINLAPIAGSVKADPAQLEQVILNLAVNARDAMPQGGELRIATAVVEREDQRWAVLDVRDTGIGMDDATRERIFEPFFTTKEVGKGTGLGLSMVYGVVRQSGGQIEVKSAPGAGSDFCIYLPLVAAADEEEAPSEPVPQPRHEHMTILLAEDDDAVREFAAETLTALGHTVLSVRDGKSALERSAAYENEIHLLITDLVMPLMSGRDLAVRLARDRPGLKVLYMSGYADDHLLRGGAAGSGAPVLAKPFSASELERAVHHALTASAHNPIILVVEDQLPLQSMMQKFLAERGYDVLLADTAIQALEMTRATPVDLVITGPGAAARERAAALKQLRDTLPDLPILDASGMLARINGAAESGSSGGAGICRETPDMDRVAQAVRKLLRASGRASQNNHTKPRRPRPSQ